MNHSTDLSVGINELAYIYDLMTFGNSFFLLKVKFDRFPLVLKSKHNDGAWKGKYFFIRRDSILDGNLLPQSWVRKGRTSCFYIEDLDIHFSYLF